jgi:hypothetical protein
LNNLSFLFVEYESSLLQPFPNDRHNRYNRFLGFSRESGKGTTSL